MDLTIIADDYGLSPGIGRGVRRLLDLGRLSGTSCMTVFPEWPDEGGRLRDHVDADVGLHLVLTDHAPLGTVPGLAPDGTLPDFPTLARRAFTGRLDTAGVLDELRRQVDAFVDVVGRPPSHLDGHHHVHQLPGLRDLVLALRATHPALARAWVRTSVERVPVAVGRRLGLGRALSFAWAGTALRRALVAAGVPTNDGFSGVYGFDERGDHGARFDRFLRGVRPGTLLCCHPGEVDPILVARDGLQGARRLELDWLASDAFPAALARHGVTVGRPRA